MSVLVYFSFDWPQKTTEDILSNNIKKIVHSINNESEIIFKILTENTDPNEAGWVYIFTDHQNAILYIEKHKQRIATLGATNIVYKIFDINKKLANTTSKYLQ